MPKERYTNKSSVHIHGVAPGADFEIDVDDKGTPKKREWRRRVKDSKLDGCIVKKQAGEVVVEPQETAKESKKATKTKANKEA